MSACTHGGTSSNMKDRQALPAAALNHFSSRTICLRHFRRLSKVPSCRKLLAASPLSRLDHEGKASGAGAALLTLRAHWSAEEQLREGGRESCCSLGSKGKRNSGRFLGCLVLYPLTGALVGSR